jgi:flagellar biosynthesis protein FlhG
MIHDQADELRQLVRRQATVHPRGPAVPLFVLSGAKGGVGTSTIAVNLAVALARQGKRAMFVDADLDHGGNAPFGYQNQRGSISDVLAGRRTLREAIQRGPSGIDVLAGAWPAGEQTDCSPAAHERLISQLKDLSPHAEVAVIDAGSSRNSLARRLWQAASCVLVVTSSEPASVMECYATIKMLAPDQPRPLVHALLNVVWDAAAAADAQARIAEACRRFLGLRLDALPCVPPCASNPATEPPLIFPARWPSARALDRLCDTLWAQVQLVANGDTATRRQAA